MLEFQEEDKMIFRDINGVLDPKKDITRIIKSGQLSKNTFRYLDNLKLEGAWRITHSRVSI